MGKPKEQWGTRIGVILAVAGSAVGLGNFLRFPGQAAENGGGAFMIPYFCALIFVGIPICWAEWIMGRYGGQKGFNSCPAIFGVLGRRSGWRYMGVVGLIIPICVYMFYVLIESWCLGYAWAYLTGSFDLGDDPTKYVEKSKDFYTNYVGKAEDGAVIGSGIRGALVFWIATFAINFFLIFRGVSKGIEAFCIRAMPIMGICAFIVLIRVLTLGTPDPAKPELSVTNGLGFMWNPKAVDDDVDNDKILNEEDDDLDGDGILNAQDTDVDGDGILNAEDPATGELPWYFALLNPKTWLAAAGQIFFSLSVGFGIIVNYASYMKRNDDVVLSGLTAASTNEFFEVCLGGLITLTAAFVFLGIAGATEGGYDLAFSTLPVVFEYMGGIGRVVGFCWFFMLFLAAITSSMSMLQPAIAFLEEGLNIGRKASVTILGLITALGSFFIIYHSSDLTALNTVDTWIGTVMIFVLAMIEVILFSWVFGAEKGFEEGNRGAELKLPRAWKFIIKYVSPVFLVTVFVSWCWTNLGKEVDKVLDSTVATMAILMVVAVLIFLVILIHIASRRWNGLEKTTQSEGAS